MNISGLPERFFVVVKPSPGSGLEDILFPCTFGRLMNQVRGGLQEDEIVGIFADEGEARQIAARSLGKHPVRPQDALFAEVVVHVMVQPKVEGLTVRELGAAAVEAVTNAIHQGEVAGFRHHLGDQVSLGMSDVMELRSQIVVCG